MVRVKLGRRSRKKVESSSDSPIDLLGFPFFAERKRKESERGGVATEILFREFFKLRKLEGVFFASFEVKAVEEKRRPHGGDTR